MAKNFKAWPKDWPKCLNYPEIPVHAFLDQTAARVPNRMAIIFGGMELTYGELKLLSERFATALDDMGVRKGDRVAIHLPNMPQFAIAYYHYSAIFFLRRSIRSDIDLLQGLREVWREGLYEKVVGNPWQKHY